MASFCSKVFESFSQADSSITRQFGGTGLGLTISSELANMMGGELSVNSEVNKGSTFTFKLPIKKASNSSLTKPPEFKKPSLENKRNTSLSGAVLLVDDNITNLALIGKILKKSGLEVECCMNGEEAIKLLTDKAKFDLVIMDVQMPVMDGLTAVSKLKEQGYSQPVIALTANNMKGDKEKCLEAGYDAFASKPINKNELFRLLDFYLINKIHSHLR